MKEEIIELTPMFMAGQKFIKIQMFGKHFVCTLFMGENLRQNLAQDFRTSENVGFRANVSKTFCYSASQQNVCLEAAGSFRLQAPHINTDHSALNTPRIKFLKCSGQP